MRQRTRLLKGTEGKKPELAYSRRPVGGSPGKRKEVREGYEVRQRRG